MVQFDWNGISLHVRVDMVPIDYKDASNLKRTRFEKKVRVSLGFWDFSVQASLQELAYIKATLIYFMQGYWKRSGKQGSRIELSKTIQFLYNNMDQNPRDLSFTARQKNSQNFLQIHLDKNGQTVNEVYLDGQEVLMFDIAIGKAIQLLMPTTRYH